MGVCLWFKRVSPLSSWQEGDTHGNGAVGEWFAFLIPIQREGGREGRRWVWFGLLKTQSHFQWHASLSKAIPPNPSQFVKLETKYMTLQGVCVGGWGMAFSHSYPNYHTYLWSFVITIQINIHTSIYICTCMYTQRQIVQSITFTSRKDKACQSTSVFEQKVEEEGGWMPHLQASGRLHGKRK